MLQVIKKYLLSIIEDIDAGNTNADEEELLEAAKILKELVRKDKLLSKYQAYTFLGISRATFDNYVRDGKIPKGIKIPGHKELWWNLKDLNNITKKKPR